MQPLSLHRSLLLFFTSACWLTLQSSSAAFLQRTNQHHKNTNTPSFFPAISVKPALLPSSFSSHLLAKKKAAAAAAPQKLQVKLLKPIPGTGQKGDIVKVTPAFYQNKLQPTRAAEIVSNEQVEQELRMKQEKMATINEQATRLQTQLQAEDFEVLIKKKTGPDGHLFGGVGVKLLMKELQDRVKDDFLQNAKIKEVLDSDNKAVADIKNIGEYKVTIELTKDIKATFPLKVDAE
jgi:ribosomal protein L9